MATTLASDQRARCTPALESTGVGSAGWGRGCSGRGAGVEPARGSVRAGSAAWIGQECVLWCVVRFSAATCALTGADIARGVAPAPSIIRSAIIAEEAAGPACHAGALRVSWAWCHMSVGRHASADAPISRHHSRGQGACRRAGDCWSGGASGAACGIGCGGGGVGVGVGVRLGARVGGGSGVGGGAVRESGAPEEAPVSMGELGGAGSLMSPWFAVAAGGLRCSSSHPWEWRGAVPVWAARSQSPQHGPPVYRAGRSQPGVAQRPVVMSGWGGGSQGRVLLLASSVSSWLRR